MGKMGASKFSERWEPQNFRKDGSLKIFGKMGALDSEIWGYPIIVVYAASSYIHFSNTQLKILGTPPKVNLEINPLPNKTGKTTAKGMELCLYVLTYRYRYVRVSVVI